LTAGDSGIVFEFYPTVVNPSNPTQQIPLIIDPAATVLMLAQLEASPPPAREEFLMVRSPNGNSASYILNGSEFTIPGMFRISMRILLGDERLTADESVLFKVDADFV
jgi:hypothetical protein